MGGHTGQAQRSTSVTDVHLLNRHRGSTQDAAGAVLGDTAVKVRSCANGTHTLCRREGTGVSEGKG